MSDKQKGREVLNKTEQAFALLAEVVCEIADNQLLRELTETSQLIRNNTESLAKLIEQKLAQTN